MKFFVATVCLLVTMSANALTIAECRKHTGIKDYITDFSSPFYHITSALDIAHTEHISLTQVNQAMTVREFNSSHWYPALDPFILKARSNTMMLDLYIKCLESGLSK